MKIQNAILITYMNILGLYADKKLPQKICYAITKNILLIENELAAYQKSLSKIIEKYNDYIEKDENDETILLPIGVPQVDDKHKDDYIREINELLSIEVDVNLYKIDENNFDYVDSERYDILSAKDIITLRNILCEGVEDEEVNR